MVTSVQPHKGIFFLHVCCSWNIVLLAFKMLFFASCECLNHPNIPPSPPENPPTGWLIAPNRRTYTEFIFHVLFNPVA